VHVGPSGFKHRGTHKITRLMLRHQIKAARDNCFGDSADIALFLCGACWYADLVLVRKMVNASLHCVSRHIQVFVASVCGPAYVLRAWQKIIAHMIVYGAMFEHAFLHLWFV
jgi:hypothetical protein